MMAGIKDDEFTISNKGGCAGLDHVARNTRKIRHFCADAFRAARREAPALVWSR